jgi:hypothetical protein
MTGGGRRVYRIVLSSTPFVSRASKAVMPLTAQQKATWAETATVVPQTLYGQMAMIGAHLARHRSRSPEPAF